MISFLNIYKQDKIILDKIIHDIKSIIKKTNFILGDEVTKFEVAFAKYCNVKYAISCANGTDALILALKALHLPKNSEILVPTMTYCASVFSIIHAGYKPVLIDIDCDYATISIEHLKKKINKRTRAILIVHLYGNSAKFSMIKKFIKKKNIIIIEDAAQAHGAYDCSSCLKTKKNCCKNGNKVGSMGRLACFSFYPGKNLGAYGDGGIITTNNLKDYLYIRKYRNLGSQVKNKHDLIGVNSRLDTIQAAVLNNKLKLLDSLNAKRKKIAEIYCKKINNPLVTQIKYSPGSVFHQFVILVKKRKKFESVLKNKKIQFGRHYPLAIHQLKALKKMFKNQKYPNAENLSRKCISLPIDPNLKSGEITKIYQTINSVT
jgi:dTDP-4-amino-4,6-dideoxygalactose transaminase